MSPFARRAAIAGATLSLSLAAGVPAASAHRHYSPMDEQALTTSIQGDRFEVIGGRIAQTHAAAPQVRALGRRLVKDHSKSLSEAVALARKLGISVPKKPTPSEVWELSVVRSVRGATFDRLYTTLEVQDHRQDIMETKDEIKGGCNHAVVADFRKELPVLKTHLKLSKAARRVAQGEG